MNKYKAIQATLPDFNKLLDYDSYCNIHFIESNMEYFLDDIESLLKKYNPRLNEDSMASALCYKKHRERIDTPLYCKIIKSLPYDIVEMVNNQLLADITPEEMFNHRYTGNKLRELIGKRLVSDLLLRKKYIIHLSVILYDRMDKFYKLGDKLNTRQNYELFAKYREVKFLYSELILFVYGR
jgi:hypothetical protein